MRVLNAIALAVAILASGSAAARAAEYTIVLDQMQFGPLPAALHPGDTIVWQNDDILRHSATARDNSFDLDLPAHGSATLTVGAAGTVEFYCKYHPDMTGTLVITP